jgi:hypothetical protein
MCSPPAVIFLVQKMHFRDPVIMLTLQCEQRLAWLAYMASLGGSQKWRLSFELHLSLSAMPLARSLERPVVRCQSDCGRDVRKIQSSVFLTTGSLARYTKQLPFAKITTLALSDFAHQDDLQGSIKEHRRVNPNLSMAKAKKDFRLFATQWRRSSRRRRLCYDSKR